MLSISDRGKDGRRRRRSINDTTTEDEATTTTTAPSRSDRSTGSQFYQQVNAEFEFEIEDPENDQLIQNFQGDLDELGNHMTK